MKNAYHRTAFRRGHLRSNKVKMNDEKIHIFGIQMVQANVNSNVIMIYPVKAHSGSVTPSIVQNVVQIGLLILPLVIVDRVHAIIRHVLPLNGINVLLVLMVMN